MLQVVMIFICVVVILVIIGVYYYLKLEDRFERLDTWCDSKYIDYKYERNLFMDRQKADNIINNWDSLNTPQKIKMLPLIEASYPIEILDKDGVTFLSIKLLESLTITLRY